MLDISGKYECLVDLQRICAHCMLTSLVGRACWPGMHYHSAGLQQYFLNADYEELYTSPLTQALAWFTHTDFVR
jgi:hypothetical protein